MAALKSYLIALTTLLSLTFSSAHRAQILSPIVVHGPIPAGPIAAEPALDSSPLAPVPVPAGPLMPEPVPAGPRTPEPVPAGPREPVPAGPYPPKAAGPIPAGPSPPMEPEHVVPKSAPVQEAASVPVSSVPRGAGDVAAEGCGGCDHGGRIPGCGCQPPPIPKPYYCQPTKNCGVGGVGGGFTIYLGGDLFAAPAVSGDHEVKA